MRRKIALGLVLALGVIVAGLAGAITVTTFNIVDYIGVGTTPSNPTTGKGRLYFSTADSQLHCLTSSGASCLSGGGGGTCPSGVSGLIQYTNGTNCASDASLTHSAATLSTTVLGNGTSSVSTFAADAGGFFGLTVDANAGQVTLAANDIAGRILDFESTGGTDINSSANVSINGATGISEQVGDASAVTPGSVLQRAVTAGPDAIVSGDRNNRVVYNSTSSVAVSIVAPAVAGFKGGFNTRISNQNTGVVTLTGTATTINGNATLVLQEGQFCFLTPSSTNTAWAADCGESQTTAGTGIVLTRGVHTLSVALSQSVAQTMTFSGNGAASTSGILLNGTPFLAGTGTTNFPYLYLDFGASKPTSFSTGGVLSGINAPSGFLGNFVEYHLNGAATVFSVSQTGAINTLSSLSAVGVVQGSKLQSSTNCSSSASPAVCAAASMGTVNIAATTTTITVNTTAVTANSEIMVVEDSSLGTKLGVTCNTTIARTYAVTARTAATSFVITTSAAPVTNPACLSYWVMN